MVRMEVRNVDAEEFFSKEIFILWKENQNGMALLRELTTEEPGGH